MLDGAVRCIDRRHGKRFGGGARGGGDRLDWLRVDERHDRCDCQRLCLGHVDAVVGCRERHDFAGHRYTGKFDSQRRNLVRKRERWLGRGRIHRARLQKHFGLRVRTGVRKDDSSGHDRAAS